jgi:hypothetical protein
MAELVTLTAAEVPPSNTRYKLDTLTLNLTQNTIAVHLVGENGEVKDAVYGPSTSPTGATLLSSLNTSNNTSTSLVKRVYQRLIADGVLAGSISGSPQ